MQIGCKKFGCQKAVEVCYWACKFRRNCKDWAAAIHGTPGLNAITDQLQTAAQKTGRPLDRATIIKPGKPKRMAASSHQKSISIAPQTLPPMDNGMKPEPSKKVRPNNQVKLMSKQEIEAEKPVPTVTDPAVKKAERKQAPKPPKAKGSTDGTVYLLLYKNGKYKELREQDLLQEAGNVLRDGSLRLIKGQHLVPQITFTTMND